MIANGEKWDYIALKSELIDDGFYLSRSFRGMTYLFIE